MIRATLSENGTANVIAEIDAILNFRSDLTPVSRRLEDVVQEGNKRDRLAGLDARGGYLPALAPSTLRRRRGCPLPFVEHGQASRAVANLIVMVGVLPGQIDARIIYAGMPWLDYHSHTRGAGVHNPLRDIVGISPETVSQMDAVVVAEADRQFVASVKGASRWGVTNHFFGMFAGS